MSELYSEGYKFFTWQNEVDVLLSLMSDKELMSMRDRVNNLINEKAFEGEKFPLSGGGLNFLIASIMFTFWVRKGKGIKLVMGEIVVCELKDSPFWERYQAPDLQMDEKTGEYFVEGEKEEEPKPEPELDVNREDEEGGEWT